MASLRLGRPRDLESALVEWVGHAQADEILRRVTVVCGSTQACSHLSGRLARDLGGYANVHILTLHRFARDVAAPELARRGLRWAAPLVRERLLARLAHSAARGADWYFAPVAGTPGLAPALMRAVADLREGCLPAAATGAGRSRKVAHLLALYRDYCAALDEARFVDDAGLYAAAEAAVAAGRADGPLALTGLYDFPEMQARLVERLVAAGELDVFMPWLGEAGGYARPARLRLERAGLGVENVPASSARGDLEEVRARLAGAAGATAVVDGSLRVLSVVDSAAERREVVREVLAAAGRGGSLHEIAVIVPESGARADVARALLRAGVPVAARLPTQSPGARVCGLLLDCLVPESGRELRRDAVMELAAALHTSGDRVAEVALWDELSRSAGVVAGADEWRLRLGSLGRRLADEGGEDVEIDDPACAPRRDLRPAAADSLSAFVTRLAAAGRTLPRRGRWSVCAASLAKLAHDLADVPDGDPALETLQALAALDEVDDEVAVSEFATVARRELAALDSGYGRVGRDGVAVLSPEQARGLVFAQVVFCDLAEGGFPPRPTPDPVLADDERADLERHAGVSLPRSSARADEARLLFALALECAAREALLVHPRRDAMGGSPRLPSPALLDMCRAAAGRRVSVDEVDADGGCGGLVRHVAGDLAGLAGSSPASSGHWQPVDEREYDLAAALGARAGGGDAAAAYVEILLGADGTARRQAAHAAWRSRALTAWDGFVGDGPDLADELFSVPVSPTALQTYLDCPFLFYIGYVLGLEAADEPEDMLEIEPVVLGTLAHRILQEAYQAAVEAGGPSAGAALEAFDRRTGEIIARAEARGVTGFPLAWTVRRDQLVADLRRSIADDDCWSVGPPPVLFEWAFGNADEPPVELELDRRTLSFRGRADRIDHDPQCRHVRLIDYKTGAGVSERRQVGSGRNVQLPVYLLAAERLAAPGASLSAEFRMVLRKGGFRTVALSGGADDARRDLTPLLSRIVAAISAGLYPRWPDQRRCEYCDLSPGCRADGLGLRRKADDPVLAALVDLREWRHDG